MEIKKKKKDIKNLLLVLSVVFIGPVFLYCDKLLIRTFLLDSFVIPFSSMIPTLWVDDRVYVNKSIFGTRIYRSLDFYKNGQELNSFRLIGLRSIHHNDIVIFNMPNQNGEIKFIINYVFCKRCVGLSGDSAVLHDGYYSNNNYHPLGKYQSQKQLSNIPDSYHIAPNIASSYS